VSQGDSTLIIVRDLKRLEEKVTAWCNINNANQR
jgi:hypothetical protein